MTPETIAYWLGAVGLLVGIVIVARLLQVTEGDHGKFGYLMIIPAFAALSYVVMALGIGDVTVEGVGVPAPRYVDWLVTTPVLIGYAAYVAGASREAILGAVGLDAAMIVIGWGGVVTTGTARLAAFGFSSLAYVGLLVALYYVFPKTAREQPDDRRRLYGVLQNHVGLLWVAYPVMWAAGPLGLEYVTAAELTLLITFSDVAAKTPYVYFVYAHRTVFGDEPLGAASRSDSGTPAAAD